MTVQAAVRGLRYRKLSDNGLTAQVYREDEKKGIVFVSYVTVPIVDYSDDYKRTISELQNAKPGNYFLQILLPDGRILTEKFKITASKAARLDIQLDLEGPHEWTDLYALKGQFKHETRLTKGFTKSLVRHPKLYMELADKPKKGYALGILAPDDNGAAGMFKDHQILSNLSELVQDNLDVTSAVRRFGLLSKVTQPTFEGDDYALFRFTHSHVLREDEQNLEPFEFGPGTGLSRHYLIQESVSGGALICLPTPWTSHNGQEPVELLVNKNAPGEATAISMTIGDPMINTVLGYINMGAIHEAAKLFDFKKAKEMLFEKIAYPLAATVGGYLLVFGMNLEAYKTLSNEWKYWIENLDHWFEWLPDGSVLHAALHFMLGGSDHDTAYDALKRAYTRGLPFFTFGLKLMLDGFRYFAREGMEQANECLDVLKIIARYTDPSQPFLTVQFSRRL